MRTASSSANSVGRKSTPATWGDLLREALDWALTDRMFAGLSRHGNTGWTPRQLIVLVVLWVWSDRNTLTRAFAQARRLAMNMTGEVAVTTYQGLTGAMKVHSDSLLPRMQQRLHTLMKRVGGNHWRIGKWLPLAVDGSRTDTPRTKSNEAAFAVKNYGRGKKARSRRKWKNKKRRSRKLPVQVRPQIWLTLLWHMGLKMPWSWKTGPTNASERHDLMDLLKLESFPKNTLFCGDAGFVGYELWETILSSGHQFLVRVGGNVTLLTDLPGVSIRGDVVCFWPRTATRKKLPPLVLRLIEIQNERGRMFLLTSILSRRDLSHARAIKLYRMRWGIELQFRSLKQTFGRGRLHSRSAECAIVELDWSLIGLWMVQLFAVKEQIKVDRPPEGSSVSLSLSLIQEVMEQWSEPASKPTALQSQLRDAVHDTYQRRRSKQSRYRATQKDKPSATGPRLIKANPQQQVAWQQLKQVP